MGRGVEYRPKGYVIALFHAFNQSQSILLDYTRIGEVVQLKGPGEYLDTSDTGEESPYSSLEGVKLAVTDGNMTDADKLELERMLRESQEKLEKLQVENKNLLELLQNQSTESKEEVSNLHPADVPQQQAGSPGQEPKALKDLKGKYLLLHGEKMQLLEKLEERDAQLQQLREESLPEKDDRPPVSHPEVERSLSTDDLSPADSKAEIRILRKVIEEKDLKIDNLNVQLRAFDAVASGNMSLGEEIAELKDKLQAAQAEIKALSDQSELVQVYNSLRTELVGTRDDLSKSENRAADAEAEKDILQNEISAERDNNQKLRSEVARLTLALHFYETRYPQGDAEGLYGLADGSMKPQKDGEVVEQLKTEITDLQARISQKEAAVMSLTKSRRIVESRLQRVQEERDRLAEQIVSLVAVRDNLKRELKDTVQVKEQLQDSVVAMETEAEGWKREKEEMIKEIQDLQDDLGARRQEIAILREDLRLVVDESNQAKKWRAQEQSYCEHLQNFDRQLQQLTRESEQREMRLTIKLKQKVKELQRVTDNAIERQREFDAICDQLRQERDNMQTERDRYKDERDTWCTEYNKDFTEYEEKRKQHIAEVDKINEEMDLWKAKYSILEDHVRETELKNKRDCELAASQLSNQLQEIAHQLNTEKQEKGQLLAKLAALNHQYSLESETWLTDKSNMDHAISNMTQQVQELQRISEILRGRLQTEQMKVQQLERELQSSQELLQSHSKRAEKKYAKLEEKVEEWKGRATNAIDRQREFETFYEQLRLELDRVQMDRDHFEKERDNWSAEYNRAMTMHEEMKHQHRTIQDEKLEIQGRLADLNHQWQLDLAAWQEDKQRFEQEATRLSEELMHLRQQLRQADVAKCHPLGDEL